ncbi:MAG: AAA family ATPase [Pseudomonadota bacterium]
MIAVANMKGGVGKTATVVSLAEALAAHNKKVLVIDLDSQASASFSLAGDEELSQLIDKEKTVEDYMLANLSRSQKALKKFIRSSVSNVYHLNKTLDLSLVPSSIQLRYLEREIVYELTNAGFSMSAIEGRTLTMLQRDLKNLREDYDFILFDCAPGISAFTEVAIRLSDLVIVPTIPDRLSTLGLPAFCNSVWRSPRNKFNKMPVPSRPPWVLFTIVRSTVKAHQETMTNLREEASSKNSAFKTFDTTVPQSAAIPKALALHPGNETTAYPTYASKWGGLDSMLDTLVSEVKGELNGSRR